MTAPVVVHVGGAPTYAWRVNRLGGPNAAVLEANGLRLVDAAPDDLGPAVQAAEAEPGTRSILVSRDLLGPAFEDGRGLYPSAREPLEALRAALGDRSPVAVVTVCPPSTLLELFLQRRFNRGGWVEPAEWLAELDLTTVRWSPLLSLLAEVFGPQRVRAVDVRSSADAADHAHRILACAGVRLRAALENVPLAPAMSAKAARMGVAARPHLATREERERFAQLLLRHFSEVDYPRFSVLPDPQRRRLDELDPEEADALSAALAGAGGAS